MGYNARVIEVLIASPGDVNRERELIAEAIYDWNCINSRERSVVLLPLRWETHAFPELGTAPQAAINRQVVDHCDMAVGVFWTRLGTPTSEAQSGTAEEIARVADTGKPVMLYFSRAKADLQSIDWDEYGRLRKFQTELSSKALIETYRSTSDFRQKFARQLAMRIQEILLLAEVQPSDAWRVGIEAFRESQLGLSEQAFRKGMLSTDPSIIERCALGLADLANLLDRFEEARKWRERAAHPESLMKTTSQEADLGQRLPESAAEEWYLRVAGVGGGDPVGSRHKLVIDHEHVVLNFDGRDYRQKTMRTLRNMSDDPIDRYPFRIAVARYPEDPERNRQQYRKYPLTIADSALRAWQESELYGTQSMNWEVEQDLEAFKEIWLLFKNDGLTFPLLSGMTCSINYEYSVSNKHWGQWSKRKVRIPTNKLSLEFSFPAAMLPEVIGSEISVSGEPAPLTIVNREKLDLIVFTWEANPPLNAQYRFEWHFGHDVDATNP
jgi:hypothetical protein